MSLILDALRKSEAERRRGQAPSLYADTPAPSSPLRPAWMPWLPVAGGILLLVGVAVFFTRGGDAPVTKEELVEDSDASLVTAPAAGTDAVAPTPAATAPVSTNAPPLPPPPPADARAHAAPATNRASVDALVPPPANPAAAAADATSNAAPAARVGAPTNVLAAPVASAPAGTAEAPVEDVPPVAVLDPTTRGALPPMKLSMHVYNPDPARRFAIIDGQRVTEGAQLGTAIVLEIRRDGVLIDVSGRRVLLPRP